MSRRLLVLTCFVGVASSLGAQQEVPSYTQMIFGVGHTFKARAYALGFEHKPANSPIAWRVLLERWNRETFASETSQGRYQTLFGAQFVGLRLFRQPHRLQPYILGGLGLYHEKAFGPDGVVAEPDGSIGLRYGHSERLIPTMIWGTGLNVRVRRVTLFGEVKLPMPSQGFGLSGPAAPLTFGIRF
jgi:hypothetical protein